MTEIQNPTDRQQRVDKLNTRVAISVALLSVTMAICKVKDDNICQAMQFTKASAVDTWNEYQAKKIKQHIDEQSLAQIEILEPTLPGPSREAAATHIKSLRADISRYQSEELTLKAKAEGADKAYDDLNFKDDQFDLSDAALSVSLGMMAVSALAASSSLLAFSWVFAAIGGFFGAAAFSGWSVHPDWLIKFLS